MTIGLKTLLVQRKEVVYLFNASCSLHFNYFSKVCEMLLLFL
jgi:hypothetical protein